MEKRVLIVLLISFLFFSVYSYIGGKYSLQKIEPQNVTESEQSLPQEKETPVFLEEETVQEINLPQEKIGEFIVTYSALGGYIKELSLGEDSKPLPFKNIGFQWEQRNLKFEAYIGPEGIIFASPDGVKKEFYFKGYVLEMKFSPPLSRPVSIFSNYLSSNMLDSRYQEVFYFQDLGMKRISAKKVKETFLDKVVFAGARDKYYCASLLKGIYDIKWIKDENQSQLYLMPPVNEVFMYIGPQSEAELKTHGLQRIIYYGFFHPLAVGMTKLLFLFHMVSKSWGLSIVLFSIFIYSLLFPFTAKSTKAMRQMQEFQPQIDEIKIKYKDNPQKMQKEMMELYKKHKINPLGGCLPLFFQFPVFIALYQTLLRLVNLKGSQFLWIKDLSLPDRLFTLPFNLPILNTNSFNLLPVLVLVLTLIQQKFTPASSSSSQQKSMGLFMAVFIGFIFYNFPSALVLYWFTQNLLTLLYQARLAKAKSA